MNLFKLKQQVKISKPPRLEIIEPIYNPKPASASWSSLSITILLANIALLTTAQTASSQTALDGITTHREDAPITTYTTRTYSNPTPADKDYNYTWGGTNGNLILDGVTVPGKSLAATNFADQINLVRVDNSLHTGNINFIWAEDANPAISGTPYNLAPAYPGSNMEDALLGSTINIGSDNIFVNDDQSGGNNIERIDYIFSDGIQVASPNNQGFIVLERGGNDGFKMAGIQSLSGITPSSYGSNLVTSTFEKNDIIPIDTDTLKDPDSGPLANLPFRSDVNGQSIEGVFISFAELGFEVGDTVYGYSLVAEDADRSCLENPNDTTCPTNTSSGNGGMDFISGGAVFSVADFGDAPDTYGTNSGNNNGEGSGASHTIVEQIYLGATPPDSEINAATPLDGTGDGTDEDGISSFPDLSTSSNSYSLTATVNNTTGSAANVFAWIDFDLDGEFDEDERATVSNGSITLDGDGKVPTGSSGTVTLNWDNLGSTGADITDGDSYLRIRLTTEEIDKTPETTERDDASVGIASDGEVEDYKIAIVNAPNLLLVKRITDINPNPNSIDFAAVVDDGISNSNDDDSKWKNNLLQGQISLEDVQPGDELEYTIYFLSNGSVDASNFKLCDVVPDNMTLVESGYGFNTGISLFYNNVTTALSNDFDSDRGEFYRPNTNPPTFCQKVDQGTGKLVSVNSGNNSSGAIVVEFDTPLTYATGTGIPINSYGYIRFRVKVK